MKTDLYTKVILTIIAACLVTIVLRNISFATPANAAPATQSSYSAPIDVRVINTPKVSIETPYDGLNVNVKNIKTPYNGLDVNVKKIETPYRGLDVYVTNK